MVTCGLMVDLDFGLSVLDSDSDTEVDFRVLGQNRRLKCWYFNLQFMFERLQSIVEEDGGVQDAVQDFAHACGVIPADEYGGCDRQLKGNNID